MIICVGRLLEGHELKKLEDEATDSLFSRLIAENQVKAGFYLNLSEILRGLEKG